MTREIFIFAQNTDEDRITAALSCPDEKTARKARRRAKEAFQKMGVSDSADGFHFGCVEIDATELRIRYSVRSIQSSLRSLPAHGLMPHPALGASHDIRLRERNPDGFDIDELESAELETKKILSESTYFHRRDMQFMHYAELAINDKMPVEQAEKKEVMPDFGKEGDWVSQDNFAQRTNYSKTTLRNHREKGKGVQWLNKERTLGKTRAGHFFKKTGNKSNSTYQYFLYDDPEKNRRFMK